MMNTLNTLAAITLGLLLAATAEAANPAPSWPYPQGRAFPLALYEVEGEEVPQLAGYGWNIFQSYQPATTNAYSDYLGTLAENKVVGLCRLPSFGAKTNKEAWPETKIDSWIHALGVSSNVGWWDLPEEARPWMAHESKMLRDYTAWTRRDDPAQRPTYEYTPNNRTALQIAKLAPGMDIIGLSCYCEEINMPHAWVRYKVEEVGLHGIALAGTTAGPDYLKGQKIPVAVLYCAKHLQSGRLPTPDETTHDFWSAIVSGAQGIGVYAYRHAMKDDPALAQNFQRLNEAATQMTGPEKIGDLVLWGLSDPNVGFEILSGPTQTVSFQPPGEKKNFQYPSLHLLAKIRDGIIYVIAVNSTDQAVTARIYGVTQGPIAAVLPFENRSVPVDKLGNFTDSFAPWGVHIYKVGTKPVRGAVRKLL